MMDVLMLAFLISCVPIRSASFVSHGVPICDNDITTSDVNQCSLVKKIDLLIAINCSSHKEAAVWMAVVRLILYDNNSLMLQRNGNRFGVIIVQKNWTTVWRSMCPPDNIGLWKSMGPGDTVISEAYKYLERCGRSNQQHVLLLLTESLHVTESQIAIDEMKGLLDEWQLKRKTLVYVVHKFHSDQTDSSFGHDLQVQATYHLDLSSWHSEDENKPQFTFDYIYGYQTDEGMVWDENVQNKERTDVPLAINSNYMVRCMCHLHEDCQYNVANTTGCTLSVITKGPDKKQRVCGQNVFYNIYKPARRNSQVRQCPEQGHFTPCFSDECPIFIQDSSTEAPSNTKAVLVATIICLLVTLGFFVVGIVLLFRRHRQVLASGFPSVQDIKPVSKTTADSAAESLEAPETPSSTVRLASAKSVSISADLAASNYKVATPSPGKQSWA